MATFDSTKESLGSMLGDIQSGEIQLPDFQRGWVWDDSHIRSLLASVSRSFPIGAVMMLQTGNPDVKFKPRPVEGVTIDEGLEPERLILDGQQRLTSLYQALIHDTAVHTKDSRGKLIQRWYYVDINAMLRDETDREDVVVAVPEDRVRRDPRGTIIADCTTMENECLNEMFPLRLVFDNVGIDQWMMKYVSGDPDRMPERFSRWSVLNQEVIHQFQQYQVPVIQLHKETSKEAVCLVFEKVNTGGVSLSVFELLTATFAASDFSLRDDWEGRRAPNGSKEKPGRVDRLRGKRVLQSVASTDFLQAVTLVATHARKQARPEAPVSCKKGDILRLTLDEYKAWADTVTESFERAARLLHGEKLFAARDLPYQTQLVPLAAVYSVLGKQADNDAVRQKLVRWYWCGVFGELYGSAVESRFARDLPELLAWIEGGPEPTTVTESNFVADRLLTLRTRNSAAYKGLYALLLRDGAMDIRTGEPVGVQMYVDEQIDVHHIFPQAYCERNGIKHERFNSIVNKTPLSATTNRMIGGYAPSWYLNRLQESTGITADRMDSILKSHVVDPAALRSDDFEGFFAQRRNALLDRIERATGKAIARGVTDLNGAELELFDDHEDEVFQEAAL